MRGLATLYATSVGKPIISEQNCLILNERFKNSIVLGIREYQMVTYVLGHLDITVQQVVDFTFIHTSEKYVELLFSIEDYL